MFMDNSSSTMTFVDNTVYSKILNGCIYVVKYGLCSPEIFLRRVHKRQAKKLRKKGINLNVPGYEYAIAENILFNLKSLSSPLIPYNLYPKLRSILDIEEEQDKFDYIGEVFQDIDEKQLYVIQALLKTMHLLGTFQSEWNCAYCGRRNAGNEMSVSMIALPITSYIMRERPGPSSGEGHWFLSWGQQASDIEVVKALVRNWEAISWNSELRKVQLRLIKQWYCSYFHDLHGSDEPDEFQPISEVMPGLASQIEFIHQPGDFNLIFGRFSSTTPVEQFPISIPPPLPLPIPPPLPPQSLPVSLSLPLSVSLHPQSHPSLVDYTHPLSYITSLQTQSIKLKPIDLTPPNVDIPNSKVDDSTDVLVRTFVSNMFSGCGAGAYDMWGNFKSHDKDNLPISKTKSESLFSAKSAPIIDCKDSDRKNRRRRLLKNVLSAMSKIVYKYNTKDSFPDLQLDPAISYEDSNNSNTDLNTLLDRLQNNGRLDKKQFDETESKCDAAFDFEEMKLNGKYVDFQSVYPAQPFDYSTFTPKINTDAPSKPEISISDQFTSFLTPPSESSTVLPPPKTSQCPTQTSDCPSLPKTSQCPPIPQWLMHTTPPNLTTVMRMTNSNNCWRDSAPPGLDIIEPVWMNWKPKPNPNWDSVMHVLGNK